MIALIVILLLVDTIYDSYAVLHSTNWAIFSFASHYIVYCLIALQSIKYTNSQFIYLCYSIALGYTIRAIFELIKINMPYEDYIVSVNDWVVNLSYGIIVIGLIISLYAKKFKRVFI